MTITVIDIRAQQQYVRTAAFNKALSEHKTQAEAESISAAAGNEIGALLLSQIDLNKDTEDPIGPVNVYSGVNSVSGVSNTASNTMGTIISTINQQLTHECGTTEQIKLFVNKAIGFAAEIAKGIRKGVELALTALGFTPAVGGLAAKIRYIAAKVANITFYVKLINNFINDVVLVIAKIKALIEYILSLPKKLLALFAKCLKEAQDAIKKGIFEVLSAGTNIAGDDLGDAIKSLNDLRNQTTELISESKKVIEAPSKIISAITNPAALSDKQTTELIRELFPDNPPISEVVATYGNGRP